MGTFDSLLEELMCLYRRMDEAFQDAAEASGFVCQGCKDNCCRTRFYHHTLAEYLGLKIALARLPKPQQQQIRQQAVQVYSSECKERLSRLMCPLNTAGRCLLYTHRPMICRLHGVPHQLQRPDGQLMVGAGCDNFHQQCGRSDSGRLDRTPLYMAMVDLEKRFRQHFECNTKIKMTVAQIISRSGFKIPSQV